MSDEPLRLTGAEPLDPQDPLPEASWGWRRFIVCAVIAAVYVLLWRLVAKVPAEDLLTLCNNLLQLIGVVLVLYLVAPSANQFVELLATLKLRLRGPRRDGARPPDCEPDDPPARPRRPLPPLPPMPRRTR